MMLILPVICRMTLRVNDITDPKNIIDMTEYEHFILNDNIGSMTNLAFTTLFEPSANDIVKTLNTWTAMNRGNLSTSATTYVLGYVNPGVKNMIMYNTTGGLRYARMLPRYIKTSMTYDSYDASS